MFSFVIVYNSFSDNFSWLLYNHPPLPKDWITFLYIHNVQNIQYIKEIDIVVYIFSNVGANIVRTAEECRRTLLRYGYATHYSFGS